MCVLPVRMKSRKCRSRNGLLSVGDSADVAVIENADGFCGSGRHGDADRREV